MIADHYTLLYGNNQIKVLRGGLTVQGVPIRLELGPKDMEKESVMLARRDTGEKESVSWTNVATRVPQLLKQIQVPLCFCLCVCLQL